MISLDLRPIPPKPLTKHRDILRFLDAGGRPENLPRAQRIWRGAQRDTYLVGNFVVKTNVPPASIGLGYQWPGEPQNPIVPIRILRKHGIERPQYWLSRDKHWIVMPRYNPQAGDPEYQKSAVDDWHTPKATTCWGRADLHAGNIMVNPRTGGYVAVDW